jgi:hypothetical protein
MGQLNLPASSFLVAKIKDMEKRIAHLERNWRPPQYTTAARPAYVKGFLYFDTTLNKLVVGGAAHYETVTSV